MNRTMLKEIVLSIPFSVLYLAGFVLFTNHVLLRTEGLQGEAGAARSAERAKPAPQAEVKSRSDRRASKSDPPNDKSEAEERSVVRFDPLPVEPPPEPPERRPPDRAPVSRRPGSEPFPFIE